MAEPLKIVRRLNEIATDYAVFERDQVLTEQQLNSITEYLDDQSRLTRTQLLGIGIVGGLWPTLDPERLVVGKGVGVTSDGDLLGYAADTVFDRWLAYDESAPAYDRFYDGENRLPLIELLAADDPRQGTPLGELANRLPGLVAIAFMESYENDPDLCTGGDCDNKGRTAKNTRRLLLIERELADKFRLSAATATGADLARQLPRVRASRADLGTGNDAKVDVTSAEKFAARYRNAAAATLKALRQAVETLAKRLAEDGIAGLPDPAGWPAILDEREKSLPGIVGGIQYVHAHVKDLAEVWNALRAALFADDSVLCPSPDAFPKHLLLGALAEPTANRTGTYPAPWLSGGTAERQQVVLLMRKFAALLDNFALPSAQTLKITPSRRASVPLDERAIPIYYRAEATLRELWNAARQQRGESEENAGYHWMPTPEQGSPDDPFLADQGAVDFYRIEGFLGLKADVVEPAIEKLVRQRNLPIAVLSALTHNERRLIVRGPKFKKTSLHSFHYLLRQDLTSHLKDNIAYSGWLIDDVKAAGSSIVKTGGNTALNIDYVKPMETAQAKLIGADSELVGSVAQPGPLATRSYKGFVAQDKTLQGKLSEVVVSTARARVTLGEVTRNDIVSPLDSFAGSKSHLWVDWLGDILKKREDDAKDRLLLTNLLNANPGLEHAGGVVPGGTFVLVYNDAGVVIGDLMLPYWIDDNDESDLDEPPLTLPDIGIRLPKDLLPIKVIKPLDLAFDDFKATQILPEIKIQENYSSFFQKSLGSLGDVLKNTTVKTADLNLGAGVREATNDNYMRALMTRVKYEQAQLQDMKAAQSDETLPQTVRDKAGEQARQLEIQLADSVGETVQYFAVDANETVRFEADKTAVYGTVGEAIAMIGDQEAAGKLQSNLRVTAEAANKVTAGSSAVVANQVMVNAGLRLR